MQSRRFTNEHKERTGKGQGRIDVLEFNLKKKFDGFHCYMCSTLSVILHVIRLTNALDLPSS